MKKENTFIKAGLVLVVSGIVVKLLGAVYRIPLTRMLGAATMGKYSAVFSIFMPFFAFATAGIVPCVSHFSAKSIQQGSNGGKIAKTAGKLYVFQAFAVSVIFVSFGYIYSSMRQDSIYFSGAVILAPAIVFAALENICKGVTQGGMDMLPTARANVLESVSKAVLGLSGVYAAQLLQSGKADWQIKAALAAVTVSGFVCCIYLLFSAKGCAALRGGKKGYSLKRDKGSITGKTMLSMSFPVAVSALTVSVVGFFDTAVCIPAISRIPYAEIVKSYSGASFKNAGEMSMYLLGIYQGMALTVFNLLPAVLSSVGSAALPVVSRAVAKGDKTNLNLQAERIYRITASLSVPAAMYLFVFRSDILQLLFGTNSQQAVVASHLLGILMAGSIFCCFTPVFNSVLYAAGKSQKVFGILLAASVIKCVLNYTLCTVPQINIKAFAVSSVVFHTIIFILSMAATSKVGVKFAFFKVFFMPCAATAAAFLAVMLLWNTALCWLPLLLRLVFSAVIYGLVYFLIAIVTGFMLISLPENSNI